MPAIDPWRPAPSLVRPVIGNYEVVRKLATGGMGEVFLAKQRGAGDFLRDVVLKRLHPGFTTDPQFVAMFLNEARIAASLAHPNIIHIYELFEDGDGYVIAMEYVRGGTVLSLLRASAFGRNGLPYGPAVRIAIAVCDALHYAYTTPDELGAPRRVIHRDVSPSNVLVGYDGQVKLADFGVAKTLDLDATQGTSIKGKHGYLSPEQIRCRPLDQRSDVFSLGTVLWEMTTGRRLFQRDHEVQMMYAVMEEAIPRPSERVPDYPPDLEAIVMKALAREREDRYADAQEMASDLRRVARELGWDLEGQALARLVQQSLPEDQVAFGRIDSDSSGGSLRRARTTTGSWTGDESFASLEIERSVDDARPPRSLRPDAPARAGSRRDVWAALAVMLALTAVFWIWIVPRLI